MKIIFMGSPEFAVPTLSIIIGFDYEITAKELHDKCSELGGKMILEALLQTGKGNKKRKKTY